MSSQWVDFSALKGSVDIEPVLAHYGVRLKRVRKDYLRGLCPLPTHGSEQSQESFGVDTGRNVWACHSASCCQARNGKVGGNILDLVACMEVCSIREAALRLRGWSDMSRETGLPDQLVSKGKRAGPVARRNFPDCPSHCGCGGILTWNSEGYKANRLLVRSRLLWRIGISAGSHGFSDSR